MDLVVHPLFDSATHTWSYVLANPATGCCAIIDPVLGYDDASGTVSTRAADSILELVDVNGYGVEWILETHIHADHLSAGRYLKQHLVCAQTAIGEHVASVQTRFAARLGLDIATDGRQFDRLLSDGERLCIGHACGRVVHTPGHTSACVSYVFDGFVFVGDALLMPDSGTGRCDFPGGDARSLYRSVQKLYALPGSTRMLMCHDYGEERALERASASAGAPSVGTSTERRYRFSVTVAEQRRSNCMLRTHTPIDDFVDAREARDRKLPPPRLLDRAVQANVAGGALPGADWLGAKTPGRSGSAQAVA